MLDQQVAEAVVARAEDPGLPAETSLLLMRSLVRFGLSESTWQHLGARVLDVLDAPGTDAATREACVAAMAAVPHPAADQRLHVIARDPSDRGALTAAVLASDEHADLVAAHVPALVAEAAQRPDTASMRSLAALPLHRYGVARSTFDSALAADDEELRLWAMVAAAKAGHPQPLLEALGTMDERPLAFLAGNPWSAWDELHAAAPMPAEVDRLLTARRDSTSGRGRLVIDALTGLRDAEGEPVTGIETGSEAGSESPVAPPHLEREERRRLLDSFREGARSPELRIPPHDQLHKVGGLDPSEAGEVMTVLVHTTMDQGDQVGVMVASNASMEALRDVDHLELPVSELLRHHVASGRRMPTETLGAVLARTDPDVVTSAVLEQMARTADGETARGLAELLEATAISRATGSTPMLGAGGGSAAPPLPHSPQAQPPPAQAQPLPPQAPPPVLQADPPPSYSTPNSGLDTRGSRPSLWDRLFHKKEARAPRSSPPPQAPPASPPQAGAAPPPPATGRTYEAYPQLKSAPVVVAHTPFQVTVGLQEHFPSSTVTSTGMIKLVDAPEVIDFEVEIVVDPQSLTLEGPAVRGLHVTLADPFPKVTVDLTALTGPGLLPERTIRALYRHRGRIVGVASRTVVVVDDEAQVAHTPAPPPAPGQMLDLGPLLAETPPDLVVGIYRGDEPETLVWDAYPLVGSISIPDVARRLRLSGSAREFATNTRRMVTAKAEGITVFDNLVGAGTLVAGSIPPGVRTVLRDLVATRDTAPTVLFLTEEPFIPWELAVVNDPPLTSPYGGAAPFLGAHLAMARWPLSTDAPPVPRPPWPRVTRPAVLTAEYDGVANWERLPAAEAEAKEFAGRHPGTVTVAPVREDVIQCLMGQVPVDLLHVALHGQYDPSSKEDGLVLLEPDGSGWKPSFLTSLTVLGLRNTATRPFVFLNACQVGAGDVVLASYAGFAAAVLQTGATGVVAPLWNVTDALAAGLTSRFYELAIPRDGTEPVPVAEILRRFRAELVRDAVLAEPDRLGATQVAYQFFGHPAFTLQRDGGPPPDLTPAPHPGG